MPLVRVRIYLGKSLLGEPARPYAPTVTVKAVVDAAIAPFPGMELVDNVEVFNDSAGNNRTAHLPIDCLGDVHLEELISNGFGTNLVTHVRESGDCSTPHGFTSTASSTTPNGGPSSLPNSLHGMMEREKEHELVWPPRATGPYLNHAIFNALLDDLKRLAVGWHHADAIGSGKTLIDTLSRALMYALPFDEKGALKRRGVHIPDNFTVDKLKVCALATSNTDS